MKLLPIKPVILSFFIVVPLGCSEEFGKQRTDDRERTLEEKAIDYLKTKGARFWRLDAKTDLKPTEAYWSVFVDGYLVSDADLEHLKQIKGLKSLNITYSRITDQ